MSYTLELDELHKQNKQAQIDLIYMNLSDNLKELKNKIAAINEFIGTFLSRTITCDNMSCKYALEHSCLSCPRYNLALTHISQKLQFVDELYKEENPKLQEKINRRNKNQYTISLIENVLGIKFEGNIEDKDEVKNFINDNLPKINESINRE